MCLLSTLKIAFSLVKATITIKLLVGALTYENGDLFRIKKDLLV